MAVNSNFDLNTLVGSLIRANELRHKQKYRAALEIYLNAFEQAKENTDLCVMTAYCYLAFALSSESSDEDVRKALAWIEEAIATRPDEVRLYCILGQFRFLVAIDYAQAAQAYRKAIELSPDNIEALAGAASLYFIPAGVVTLDEAINWFERIVQLEPDNPISHFDLGQLYYAAGQRPGAEREWFKSLLSPKPLDLGSAQTIAKSYGIGK